MGNHCPNCCAFFEYFLKGRPELSDSEASTVDPSTLFSSINNNKFMIPKDYFSIIKQIKEKILIDETSLWPTYQLFLQNSKAYFNKLLVSLKSYQKLSVVDHIPFETIFQMETVFPKKYPRKFILEVQKALFYPSCKSPKSLGLFKPYIEIEIYPNEQKNPDRVVFFQTKIGEPNENPEWNEVFVYEFEHENIKDTGKFLISLYYIEKSILGTKKLIDKKHTFEFPELKNQRINEKIIKLKENDIPVGEIYLRGQMIFNYEKFLIEWINELEVKLEIIDRILKINAEILQTPPRNQRSSSDFKPKSGFQNNGETNYIEMTTISASKEEKEVFQQKNIEDPLKNECIKSPMLFGAKPPMTNLKLEDFSLDSIEGSAKDKNEYFDNHFFIK